jgi:hypothetical protein
MWHMRPLVVVLLSALVVSPAATTVGAQDPQPETHVGIQSRPAEAWLKGPNVRVDITIKDQRPNEAAVIKHVSIVGVAGEQGRVRTIVIGPRGGGSLNVDALPALQDKGNRVALKLSLQYQDPRGQDLPDQSTGTGVSQPKPIVAERLETRIDETVFVVLDDGTPMLVTQSADPLTDRKVSVEVKATILK